MGNRLEERLDELKSSLEEQKKLKQMIDNNIFSLEERVNELEYLLKEDDEEGE